ncbi:HIR complex subunit [Yamadazyma tenuis]|uniref:Protein HIR n=1 Tax=Candida tenuis (strain ATCC 10573 / BCRC 21748 / CBS 615 / JCM 9827 / NBRC 10315 / NRRL Y-1498 / VKM Y-70) TaxID=590646 RepID=G3BF69_CANTC|nr:WD40 repeat-like protein [Yamadazyma tenuis ATCC 10573]EGV60653.1 WD40 repeat-like protein [Yamadazyma tenuis ATCC 10573]WEJ94095.1 HIR complex subunit [Yamadazyma tenuis]
MHILKLPWLAHRGEAKKVECYSVSVNADGTRLASGGLDGNVKIWDTHTISEFKAIDGIDPAKMNELDRLLPPQSQRRPLCSMSRHNGVVTSVKFSPDGQFLASGSDDKIVLIWERDDSMANRPKQFGEVEADLEHWTVRKRLVAHENDIQDICWSPDGSLLVTVGLDRSIIIWSGTTFERIKRYDIHQSMVKGIVFDPANKFFATASDDRTVRIFRYSKKLHESVNDYEFQMEHAVFEPFKKSPLTSYFRRMSWSPDGQNIAVPNATNGPVPSVAIIKRGDWSTEVSLIGHEAPCEVCSFSPKLFMDESADPKRSDNFYTILATGGQDNTLAIWSTRQSKPLVVAHDITSSSITDICWTNDGGTLYLSCLDGSVTCVSFDGNELGKVVSTETLASQLHKYGRDRESNVFPESTQQLLLEEKAFKVLDNEGKKPLVPHKSEVTPTPEPTKQASNVNSPRLPPQLPTTVTKSTSKEQTITIKNGKKRVAPILVSVSSSKPKPNPDIVLNKVIKKSKPNSKVSHGSYILPRSGVSTAVQGTKMRREDSHIHGNNNNDDQDNDNDEIGLDVANDQANNANLSIATLKKQKSKIKRQIMEARYPNQFKLISNLSESLFNHSSLMRHEMSKIINAYDFRNAADLFSGTSASADTNDEDLIFAVLVSAISHKNNEMYSIDSPSTEPTRSIIEVRNGTPWIKDDEEMDIEYDDRIDFQDPTSVIVTNYLGDEERKKYVIYFPFKIQHALPILFDGVLTYYAMASFEGTLQIIFAESGSYLCPSLELGNNLVCLKHSQEYLMGVTSSGLIYIWKLPKFPQERHLKAVLKGVSMAPIMNCDLIVEQMPSNSKFGEGIISPDVKAIEVDPRTGSPYVILSEGNNVYQYSIELMCWTKVVDSWYFHAIDTETCSKCKTYDYFYNMSSRGFKVDVETSRIGKYIFDDSTSELQSVMKTRFDELMHC